MPRSTVVAGHHNHHHHHVFPPTTTKNKTNLGPDGDSSTPLLPTSRLPPNLLPSLPIQARLLGEKEATRKKVSLSSLFVCPSISSPSVAAAFAHPHPASPRLSLSLILPDHLERDGKPWSCALQSLASAYCLQVPVSSGSPLFSCTLCTNPLPPPPPSPPSPTQLTSHCSSGYSHHHLQSSTPTSTSISHPRQRIVTSLERCF